MAKKSGLQAALTSISLGALVEGDAATPLADNTWFRIAAIAAVGSVLPVGKLTAFFKTPDSGNAITPIIGDDVYPVTINEQCKVSADVSGEKGVIDVSDDCNDGYIENITDGYTSISGSYSQFLKFSSVDKDQIADQQSEVLNRFYDIVEDDGGGTYVVSNKSDDELVLFIFLTRKVAVGDTSNVLIVPVIVSGAAQTLENKSGQNLDVTFTKGEGWAGLYKRVQNEALDL